MHVGFVVTHTSFGSPGSFQRIKIISDCLVKFGIETTIFTPFTYDKDKMKDTKILVMPTLLSRVGLSSFAYNIGRTMSTSPTLSNFFLSQSNISHMSDSIYRGLMQALKNYKIDIIHAVQPIAGSASIRAGDSLKIPVLTDLHNIWPEEAVIDGYISRKSETFQRLKDIERSIVNKSDAVTVVSEFMKSYVTNNYCNNDNVWVLPPAGLVVEISDAFSVEQKVVYAGLITQREHVDLFAKSIEFVKSPCSFYFSKTGNKLKEINNMIGSHSRSRVKFVWFPTRQDLYSHLESSRVGILTSHNDITRQIGPPLKLFEYLSCGLPVVANNVGGWCDIIEDNKVGILTDDDPQAFASAIDKLLVDESLWRSMRTRALQAIKNKYNWEENIKRILVPAYESILRR